MTFADLQTLTSDILDDPTNGYFGLTLLKMRLNLAQRELQKRLISANKEYYSSYVKTSTVAGQMAYALPTDFIQLLRLEYVTQGTGVTASVQKLLRITPNQIDLSNSMSGAPQFWFFQHNNLCLNPVPDAVYEMRMVYSYSVVDMSGGTDVPDAIEDFHPYIAYLAARDCMVKDGRPLNAIETQLTQFETLLKQIAVQREGDGARMVIATDSLDF